MIWIFYGFTVVFILQSINRHTIQKDVTGKEIETTTVFERTFHFLLTHFTRSITCNNWTVTDSTETDAKYVIVLPTYFSENEQQFVYETAVKVFLLQI